TVVAAPAEEGIVSGVSKHHVVAERPPECVDAVPALHGVRAGTAHEGIVVTLPEQVVLAASAVQGVVARATQQDVGSGLAAQAVPAEYHTVPRIIATAATTSLACAWREEGCRSSAMSHPQCGQRSEVQA